MHSLSQLVTMCLSASVIAKGSLQEIPEVTLPPAALPETQFLHGLGHDDMFCCPVSVSHVV